MKKLIKTQYDVEGVKHYYYDDGSHTFKGFDGNEYPYKALKNMLTFHKSSKKRHSKVDGGVSISTYKGWNENCQRLAQNTNNICHYCFVDKMKFPSLINKLQVNTYNLTQRALTRDEIDEAIKLMVKRNVAFLRFEAFADVINAVQVDNYLEFARAVDEQTYIPQALYTKRPLLWIEGFKRTGKPDSLQAVFSVPKVNGNDIYVPNFILAYFDRIFIVVTKEYEQNTAVNVNCGARNCKGCLQCYRKEGSTVIIERLK